MRLIKEYCCCAIPLLNAGIYTTLIEQFVVAITVGILSLVTPSSMFSCLGTASIHGELIPFPRSCWSIRTFLRPYCVRNIMFPSRSSADVRIYGCIQSTFSSWSRRI